MTETLKSFLAGWAGGAGNLLVGYPFDTVKTVLQNDTKGQYKGAVDCVQQIIKKEGPMGIYKGIQAPLAGTGVIFALYFVAYDGCERFIRGLRGLPATQQLGMSDVLICGGFSGVVGTLVLGPAELIKVNQQTARQTGVDASFGGTCRRIYGQGGVRALTRGLGATMARDVPGSMAWFGAYEYTKMTICTDPKQPTVFQALFAGGMGGMGMWSFAFPLDTIKTRIQASVSKDPLSYSGAIKLIYSEKGAAGFFRGIAPALLRAFPANAATFAAKEIAQKGLNQVM